MLGGCGGTPLQEHQASQSIVTNGFSVRIHRPRQDLLAHMGDICDFIDQMASPALSSSTLPVEHNFESNDSAI